MKMGGMADTTSEVLKDYPDNILVLSDRKDADKSSSESNGSSSPSVPIPAFFVCDETVETQTGKEAADPKSKNVAVLTGTGTENPEISQPSGDVGAGGGGDAGLSIDHTAAALHKEGVSENAPLRNYKSSFSLDRSESSLALSLSDLRLYESRKLKQVSFSDSAVSLKASQIKKATASSITGNSSSGSKTMSFPRFSSKSKRNSLKGNYASQSNDNDTTEEESEAPTGAISLPLEIPESTLNYRIPISAKHESVKQLAASLSSRSIKSKKLETKMQQTMRLAFFDYEAKRAAEDWKFRKNIEALDLEYQKKFLTLMESHNSCQRKLQDKFIRQVKKTEKRLKKEALKGNLNEGSCFNVSQNINSFKKRNRY